MRNSAKLKARGMRLAVAAFVYIFIAACSGVSLKTPSDGISASVHGRNNHAILWKIQRESAKPNYLLGTIHLGGAWVMEIPEPIVNALSESDTFVMEVEPEHLNTPVFSELKSRIQTKLDGRLYVQAVSEGKQVNGLESIEEQLRLLSIPELQQTECAPGVPDDESLGIEGPDEALMAAYLERNLSAILALRETLLQSLTLCAAGTTADHLRHRLFTERNRYMLERMVPQLQKGSTFIAVGVAHLPGHEGLLDLLERSGYRVTSVY